NFLRKYKLTFFIPVYNSNYYFLGSFLPIVRPVFIIIVFYPKDSKITFFIWCLFCFSASVVLLIYIKKAAFILNIHWFNFNIVYFIKSQFIYYLISLSYRFKHKFI